MKNLVGLLLAIAAAFGFSLNAQATAYTWNVATGSAAWNSASDWTPNSGFPTSAGDTANITKTLTGAAIVTLATGTQTVGIINIGSTANFSYTLGSNGTGTFVMNNSGMGAQINLAPGSTSNNNNTIAAPIIIADTSGLTITAAGGAGRIQTISGPITSSGSGARNLTITDNRTGGSGSTFQVTNSINNVGSITVNSNQSGTAITAATLITGNIGSNVTSLTKSGSAILTLSGTNAYTGVTTISNGSLSASDIVVSGGASNLGNATSAVILGGTSTTGTLSYTGNTATYTRGFTVSAGGGEVDTTTSGQTLTIGTGNIDNTSGGLTTFGGAGNTTVTSVIGGGSGGVTMAGSGTLTLSGSNTYSGATTISSGSTYLTNTSGSALGTGSLTVTAGATIGGSGSASSLSGYGISGATVQAGNGGTDATNTLTLAATGASSITSSNLAFNLTTSGSSNKLDVGSTTLALTGDTLTLNITTLGVIAANTPYILVVGTAGGTANNGLGQYSGFTISGPNNEISGLGLSITGIGAPAGWYNNSYLFLVNNGSNVDDIEVEVVPEPSTWAMMIGGLATLVFIQLRKRHGTQSSDRRR